MAPTPASLPLNEYRRQVARLLLQAKECKPSKVGICAALKFRDRARNLQTIITRYESQARPKVLKPARVGF
jgi:hypothetical protein